MCQECLPLLWECGCPSYLYCFGSLSPCVTMELWLRQGFNFFSEKWLILQIMQRVWGDTVDIAKTFAVFPSPLCPQNTGVLLAAKATPLHRSSCPPHLSLSLEIGSSVAQAGLTGLKPLICLPPLLKGWTTGHKTPYLARFNLTGKFLCSVQLVFYSYMTYSAKTHNSPIKMQGKIIHPYFYM